MNVVAAVALAVFFAGVLVVPVAWFLKRRMDRCADAMIASFVLMEIDVRCNQESLRKDGGGASAPTIRFSKGSETTVGRIPNEQSASVRTPTIPKINEAVIDQALSDEMAAVMHINWLGLSARERARIKVRQPLSKLTIAGSDELETRAIKRFGPILKEFLNVKELEVLEPGTPKPESPIFYTAKPNFKILGRKIGKRIPALKVYLADHGEKLTEILRSN